MGDHRTIDLDPYKDWIIDLFHSNHTFKNISARLSREHNVTCNNCMIEWQLKTWEVSKWVRTENSSDLKKWVTALFYELCLSDKKILHILSEKKWTISYWELVQMHWRLNMWWRISVFNQEKADAELTRVVSQELNTEAINEYEWGLLYTHFHTNEHLTAQYVQS